MNQQDIKNLLYGSIRELVSQKDYYWNGYTPHLTERGYEVVGKIIDYYGHEILEAVKKEDEDRSKKLVMDTLTRGEN